MGCHCVKTCWHAQEPVPGIRVCQEDLDRIGGSRDGSCRGFLQRSGDWLCICQAAEHVTEEVEFREMVVQQGCFGWKATESR